MVGRRDGHDGKRWLVVEREEHCVCLLTGVQQTNNVFTKQLDSVPLHSVPVNSAEHSSLNSGMPKFNQNDMTLECKKKQAMLPNFIILDSSGFQQELGGHCIDLHSGLTVEMWGKRM